MSFQKETEILGNQLKLNNGVKPEDIERIVEKVGKRLRKTKGDFNSETIKVISSSKMFEGSLTKLTGGLEFQVYRDKLAVRYPYRTRKLFSLYQIRSIINQPEESTLFNKLQNKLATAFTTSIHHYKRNLSPVKESFGIINEKTPYHCNFQNYLGSIISSNLKTNLTNSLSKSSSWNG